MDDRHASRLDGHASTGQWTAEGAPVLESDSTTETAPDDSQVARATPPHPSTFLTTVVTNDEYRAKRLAELLEKAADAARRGNP